MLRTTSLLLFAVICCLFIKYSHGYVIPEIKLEAYTPVGFRVSLPVEDNNVQLFAFHGDINQEIHSNEPGTISGEERKRQGDVITIYFANVTLKIGDELNYWVHVQYNRLGYRRNDQKFRISDLIILNQEQCTESVSVVSGRTKICKNEVLLDESFQGNEIDSNKWTIEQYFPSSGPDFEFVSYQKGACTVERGRLFITPTLEPNVEGAIDFRYTCTRKSRGECSHSAHKTFIAPPVISGQIRTQNLYKNVEISIKAKLPQGDWIYPQIYLEDPTTFSRLWIAYARGNTVLTLNNKQDIGNELLFAGPMSSSSEPKRSEYLVSKRDPALYSSQAHTYTVVWSPDKLSFKVDNEEFGEINQSKLRFVNFGQNAMRLVLGVGVGGLNDFPDGTTSGQNSKPWVNSERTQVKKFFNAKNQWYSTWNGDSASLQVESVKITAL